jgi:carboxyl-terminal processing protease
MSNRKVQVWLPLIFSLVMIAGMFIGYKLRDNMPGRKSLFTVDRKTPLQEALDLINMKYVDSVGIDTLGDNAIQEMLSHLDPHSIFIPASELNEVKEDLQGNFEGIGVEFNIFGDTVHVVNVLKDGPSFKAGLQIGDRFLKVGDSIMTNVRMTSDRIKKFLKGPHDSEVKVVMLRGSEQKAFTIKRGTIPIPSVDAAYMIDVTTGYIHINKFAETTYEEFMQNMEALQGKGLKKLILDLRGNGGGLLNEAVQIADEFLDGAKLIVTTKGQHVKGREEKCTHTGLFEEGKLVLLIDEGSASASEVLAGALQDHDRATIIGRRSFGKGLVQEQYSLSDGSALRLTVARYYTPSGRCIQKSYEKGIKSYQAELLARYQDGEMVNQDSVKSNTGKAFKTAGGRTVYDGGGIMPDIFVPFDTTSYARPTARLIYSNTMNNFIYNYYIRHMEELRRYKTPVEMASQYGQFNTAYSELVSFAQKDSISLSGIPAKDKSVLTERIKSMLARQIWRTEGFYQVDNLTDNMVRKAIEVMGK